MSIEVRTLPRDEIAERLDDVAKLRITVFRAWPYLYDGEVEYERGYLRPYAESPHAVVVGAFDGRAMVGAATGTPLSDHEEGVASAAQQLKLPRSQVFYLAESVLLPAFHGRGIGHAFFDQRERHARRHGFRYAMFASVIRPEDHLRGHRWRGTFQRSGAAAAMRRSRARPPGSRGAMWATSRRRRSGWRSGCAISRRRSRECS